MKEGKRLHAATFPRNSWKQSSYHSRGSSQAGNWSSLSADPKICAGGYQVPRGQDVIVSVYNIHRNPDVWDQPDDFLPERFDLSGPVPNEQNTDYRQGVPD